MNNNWEIEDPLGECVEEEFVTDEDDVFDEDDEEESSDVIDMEYEGRRISAVKVDNADEIGGMFSIIEAEKGVEFMATRPWIGAVEHSTPDDPLPNDPTPPDQSLELEWVYGYRCHDARSNLVLNSEGNLIYPVAGIVVKYDPNEHTQVFFMEHNDDVICLSQHPIDSNIVVTGQVATIVDRRGTDPHICIWNSETNQHWKLPEAHKRAVRTVCFSPCGKMVASVGGDDKFSCRVWEWESETLLASLETSNSKIFHSKWNPVNTKEFALVGDKVLWFMDFQDESLTKSRASFDNHDREVFFALCFSPKGFLLTAGKSGKVFVWVGRQIRATRQVHDRAIYALEMVEDTIISGGRDGFIRVLDKKMNVIRECKLQGRVRSINVVDNQMAVGTHQGRVYIFNDWENIQDDDPPCLFQGHFDGELWAICPHPQDPSLAVTAGEDNRILLWDLATHKCLSETIIDKAKGKRRKRRRVGTTSTHTPNKCARAVAYKPDGSEIVAGVNTGKIYVFKATANPMVKKKTVNLNKYSQRQVKNQEDNWIQTMKFNPKGNVLAVGTHGMVIILLDASHGYKYKQRLMAHTAPITHLDWSVDSKFIQSVCIGYELLFHSIKVEHLKASKHCPSAKAVRNVKWATQECTFGWPVQGIFDASQGGTEVICDKSPSGTLIATGDDNGHVKLYRYPCLEGNRGKS